MLDKKIVKRGISERGVVVTMRIVSDGHSPTGSIEVHYSKKPTCRGWYPNTKKGLAMAKRTFINFLSDMNLYGEEIQRGRAS